MISAAIIAIVVGIIWLFDKSMSITHELRIEKAKESHADAEKIVASKTSDELVDDFNKRYPSSGAGGHKDDQDPKGSSG